MTTIKLVCELYKCVKLLKLEYLGFVDEVIHVHENRILSHN